jgi:hypothetical protein
MLVGDCSGAGANSQQWVLHSVATASDSGGGQVHRLLLLMACTAGGGISLGLQSLSSMLRCSDLVDAAPHRIGEARSLGAL